MESLIWFLIIGAIFFFMMRSGCGSHVRGGGGCGGHGGGGGHEGHGSDGGGKARLPSGKVKDPVCGMEIEKEGAYGMVRKGRREIYFCSETCYKKFNAEPGKYL